MSKVSDAVTNLASLIETNLSGYQRLANPYLPENNPELLLKQGYGIRIGSATNTDRELGAVISIERSFTVIFTRRFDLIDSDVEGKGEAELALVEDSIVLSKLIENDPTLSGAAARSRYVSDSGIEFLYSNKNNFLKTEISYSVEYFESL
jgi:hypothetical protein